MKYIKLPGTDITVSNLSLGTDSMGMPLTEEISRGILDAYTEVGGTFIDTAKVYNDWAEGEKSRSEKIIGRWLKDKGNRHKVVISTKGGHPPVGHMDISRLSRDELTYDIDKSLEHLKTDYVDLYFLHRDDESLSVDEIMDTLHGFVRDGKARAIGLSNWGTDRVKEANEYCKAHGLTPVTASQIQFGIARPNMEKVEKTLKVMDKNAYEFYKKEGMAVMGFSAQSKGYFSKIQAGAELSPKAKERYDNPISREIFEILDSIKNEYNCTVTELVLAVLTSIEDFVCIPILGCKSPMHIQTSFKASDIKVRPEHIKRILDLSLIVHN